MIVLYISRCILLLRRNSVVSKKSSILCESNLIVVVLFCVIISGCEKPIQPNRFDLLTSTIWGETNYEITDPELYTCIFEPTGQYYSYYKGYETFRSTWQLNDNGTLKISNWEVTISKLTENILEYKAPMDFFNLITINKTYHLQSLTGTKVTTIGVSDLSKTSAKLHGSLRTIDPTEVSFEYGITNADIETPAVNLTGPINRNIEINLTNLQPGTVYHYQIKAVNTSGTYYGEDHTFRTFNNTTVSDADNNVYSTVTIGSQIWMTENLKTTKFNDGTVIPLVRDDIAWSELVTPAYCWYANDSLLYGSYGVLYNWYTVNTGNLCPVGWHVPKEQEWIALIQQIGPNAGNMLMQGHYDINLSREFLEASNETGFSAIQTNLRTDAGYFNYDVCIFWSSSEYDDQSAWYLLLNSGYIGKNIKNNKYGLPIRCIKD